MRPNNLERSKAVAALTRELEKFIDPVRTWVGAFPAWSVKTVDEASGAVTFEVVVEFGDPALRISEPFAHVTALPAVAARIFDQIAAAHSAEAYA